MNSLAEFFYPEYCVLCGRFGSFICEGCLNYRLEYLARPFCPKCAGRLRDGKYIHKLCQRNSSLSGAVSLLHYSACVSKIISALKYRLASRDAFFLGNMLRLRLRKLNFKAQAIVPVPLSPERLKWRGFNQSALIAEATGLPVLDCLQKIKNPPRQAGASRQERLVNPLGAFICNLPRNGLPNRVYLLDDVMTTGATLEAAALALKTAGVTEVFACSFARDDRNFKSKGLQ